VKPRGPQARGISRPLRGFVALLLGVALLGLACTHRSEPAAAAAARAGVPAPASHVLLWRAQLGPSTVHFLGSVHVARAELYPLDPRIESAFAASDVLVLELEMNQATQLQAAKRMLELGTLPPGKRLQDVVKPETWQLLQQAEQRRGLNLFGLRGFQPWFVALALTTQALEKEGYSADQGIDEHFRQAAEGHQPPIPGLDAGRANAVVPGLRRALVGRLEDGRCAVAQTGAGEDIHDRSSARETEVPPPG